MSLNPIENIGFTVKQDAIESMQNINFQTYKHGVTFYACKARTIYKLEYDGRLYWSWKLISQRSIS